MTTFTPNSERSAFWGIGLVMVGMLCVSINDMLVKSLSDRYPLHQIVFVRSLVGIALNLIILRFEGGLAALRTRRPGLHLARALLVVVMNLSYFAALAVLPLATANALFFVAPLMITLLSIPLLGAEVGPRRIGAVVVGFLGVLAMLGAAAVTPDAPIYAMALPVLAAACYALMQILTRKLGGSSTAAAMAIYIQSTFLVVGLGFYLVAGDGRYAAAASHPSVEFVLRAWAWPDGRDAGLFLAIGLLIGILSYALSQAYRIADAATIAPFEYVALPLSVFWGVVVFGEVPGASTLGGIVLIAGSGLYVFLRERRRAEPAPPPGPRA